MVQPAQEWPVIAGESTDLATLEYQVAAMHVLAWWGEQLVYNSVILVHGSDSRSFVQLADGTFNPPPGDSTQITLLGQKLIRAHLHDFLDFHTSLGGNVVPR